eukprot:10291695-Karenia_brevis.AAC.1
MDVDVEDAESEKLPDLEGLRKLQPILEECYGKDSPQASANAAEMERVRRAKDEAKPVRTQVHIAERMAERAKKVVRALEATHQELEAEHAEIQN